jgi:nucleotide sugar dehydrogenase
MFAGKFGIPAIQYRKSSSDKRGEVLNIGIIGLGVVGSAIKSSFEGAHRVHVHDTAKNTKMTEITDNCDLAYICVPTPTSKESGTCDVSRIRSTLTQLPDGFSVVIKSTVIPGTTKILEEEFSHLRIAFCPEFLRASHALEDFKSQEIIVVGTNHDDLAETIYNNHKDAGIEVQDGFFQTTPTQAEIVKYAMNSFFAMKVIFGNQFQKLTSHLGEEWGLIKRILIYPRKRGITDTHLDDLGNYGFGGHCLPKDVAAISNELESLGIATHLIRSLSNDNQSFMKNNIK